MASVTFPTEYGGDGNTYTDDADPNTGLAQGGHRVRFVPALFNAVEMANWTKLKADETYADRLQVASDAAKAVSAKSSAETSAESARVDAQNAEASALRASSIYPSVSEGLSDTDSGAYFKVVEGKYLQLYINESGVAVKVFKLASEESLRELNERPDPLLTSLLF